jgi:hypothetical protein
MEFAYVLIALLVFPACYTLVKYAFEKVGVKETGQRCRHEKVEPVENRWLGVVAQICVMCLKELPADYKTWEANGKAAIALRKAPCLWHHDQAHMLILLRWARHGTSVSLERLSYASLRHER